MIPTVCVCIFNIGRLDLGQGIQDLLEQTLNTVLGRDWCRVILRILARFHEFCLLASSSWFSFLFNNNSERGYKILATTNVHHTWWCCRCNDLFLFQIIAPWSASKSTYSHQCQAKILIVHIYPVTQFQTRNMRDKLNCKINSTNRGTFSNSVIKIILMVSMVQGV